jgi:predicted AAA+ superfamily ATPase
MDKNEIIAILEDWNFWKKDLPIGIERPDYLSRLKNYLPTDQVIVITGARRAGKSYIMRQLVKKLITEGRDARETLFINFEDPRFIGLDAKTLQRIFEVYQEVVRPAGIPVVFLDEIQEVEGWEKWVRSMQELRKAKVIISGSNARLLSGELSTLLTGRRLNLVVFPLSFREFLSFKGLEVKEELDLIAERIKIQGMFREYLDFGSFPEVVLAQEKRQILLNYYEDVLYKDLVKRYRIKKIQALKSLARFYFSNVANLITYNSMKKFLDLSTDTVEKFSLYFQNAYLLFFLTRFSYKVREQEKSPRKVYAVDSGLASVAGFQVSQNVGRMAENLVFLELERRALSAADLEIYYWKDPQHREVDFIVKRGQKPEELIQVCWNPMARNKTRDREIKAMFKAATELKLEKCIILNEDYEGEEKINGIVARYIPLWKWFSPVEV